MQDPDRMLQELATLRHELTMIDLAYDEQLMAAELVDRAMVAHKLGAPVRLKVLFLCSGLLHIHGLSDRLRALRELAVQL